MPSGQQPAGAAVLRPAITAAIHDAVLAELAERGYGRASVESVARRAGVGKSAVYRRWPSKLELVVDVIGQAGIRPEDAPATGTLEDDVLELLRTGRRTLTDAMWRRIIPDLLAQALRVPELGQALNDSIGTPRRDLLRPMLDRAVARGDLRAGIDVELALDLIAGALYWRVGVRQMPVDDEHLARMATAVVAGLRTL